MHTEAVVTPTVERTHQPVAVRDGELPRHRLAVAAGPMPPARALRNGCAAAPVPLPYLHRRVPTWREPRATRRSG